MPLFDIKKLAKKEPTIPEDIKILIKRRRLQLIVHSCIYYRLNDNLISMINGRGSWQNFIRNMV